MNEVKRYRPFSEIPSAISWEILGRVPIKMCLACKLVCKEWYRIVKSPEFTSFHRRFNASEFAILLYRSGGGGSGGRATFSLVELKKALDVDDSGDCVVGVGDLIRVQPNIATPRGTWYLRSHCDGAICLETVTNEYVVCHLLTRRSVNVQNLHELKKPPCVIKHCELGRCPATGQFKVLMFLYDTVYEILVAKVQTLGNGEWRIVGNVPFNHLSDGCFLNGSSHWRGPTCIWSFHFGKEEFLQIPLPDNIIRAHHRNNNNNNPVESHYSRVWSGKELFVFNSCLCLRPFFRSPDVWMMKEYGVRNSWVRQLAIGTHALTVPLAQMDNGTILLKSGSTLYLYDPRTHVSKSVQFELNGLSNSMTPFAACDARCFRF
ncbi:unnamed protein product [Cuscuta campestris]|uniref:F-box domain-containing protein n=1 Tax=Cuscuta campestris TaxID=132261 RepID=A0A484MGR8_9ASTE|nr:unnamed protein product [Cuscuta campestris]